MMEKALTCLAFILLYVYGTDSLIVKNIFIRREHNDRGSSSSCTTSSHNRSPALKASSTVESVFAATAETTESVQQDYSKNVMNTYGRYPIAISHGKGTKLYDLNGKEYIDFAAGIATCCLGYANPVLKKAVSDQMDRVHHCSNLYFIPEQAELAKWIVKNSCADKVFFCNSGAEANEGAIKLARKYAHEKLNIGYPIIITALNSFHGRTLTAITATGQPKYQKYFDPLTPGFQYVEFNNLAHLKEMVSKIQEERKGGSDKGLAAIMMEPLQGEGGIKPASLEFFQGIREICDSTGAVMIVDEVQTGIGRTGQMWGYQNLNVEPDIFTSAKALGGGVPIGSMCCKEAFNVFNPGDHASTYGGNPLACAAGLAVASVFDNDNLLDNVKARGAQFKRIALQLQSKYSHIIADVRGWGLINGIEINADTGITAAMVTKELLDEGLLVVPAGPQVVRFVPPLIVSEQDIDSAMEKFENALLKLSAAK